MTCTYSLTRICTNQTTCWLMHSLGTFGARTSRGQLWTHKTHHSPDLGEATTFSLIVFSAAFHGAHPNGILSRDSHDFGRANFLLRWGLKQSYRLCWELSNDMLHIACTLGNWVDFWLLVVESQTSSLNIALSLAITCVSDVQMSHASFF
jgi:hypothetical protein